MKMKKYLYALMAMLILGLSSCIQFDDPITENYGNGPSITVSVAEITDDSFSFTLTPAEGTGFYSYLVVPGKEAQTLDSYALLKMQYEGGLTDGTVDAAQNATFTLKMEKLSPNTSYVVYAVASNQQGVAGEVASAIALTTDGVNPGVKESKALEEGTGVAVTFSEAVTRGAGAVTAKYFVEWTGEFVDIAAEDLVVAVESNVATFTMRNVPGNCYVCVSWAEGAFADSKGNPCAALTSGLNGTGDDFMGVYFQNAAIPMTLKEYATDTIPAIGSAFTDWTKFLGTITFKTDLFVNSNQLKGNEVQLTYTNEERTVTYNLAIGDWAVQGKNFLFAMPAAPTPGDFVSLKVAEGAFTDVYGNPMEEFAFENAWQFSYGYKRDMVLGDYTLEYYKYSVYSQTGAMEAVTESVTIAVDPDSENGLLISGFMGTTEPVKFEFDGDAGTITLPEEQFIGVVGKYLLSVCGNTNDGSLVMPVTADGSFAYGDIGLVYYAYDPATEGYLGMLEAMIFPTFSPAAASFSAKAATRSVTSFKLVKSDAKFVR